VWKGKTEVKYRLVRRHAGLRFGGSPSRHGTHCSLDRAIDPPAKLVLQSRMSRYGWCKKDLTAKVKRIIARGDYGDRWADKAKAFLRWEREGPRAFMPEAEARPNL
jgi:hypothetical protein